MGPRKMQHLQKTEKTLTVRGCLNRQKQLERVSSSEKTTVVVFNNANRKNHTGSGAQTDAAVKRYRDGAVALLRKEKSHYKVSYAYSASINAALEERRPPARQRK